MARRKQYDTIAMLELRLADANRLIGIHANMTGTGPGRRYEVDVLNRSAIILAVAAWESFVEDLAIRNSVALERRLKRAEDLPESIRTPLLLWIYESAKFSSPTNEARAAMWSLAGNGWRFKFRDFVKEKSKNLNTPNSENVAKLFRLSLGIQNITDDWIYRRWGSDTYNKRLDDLLRLRHRVAHGAISTETVGKTRARKAVSLVRHLGERTVESVSKNFNAFDLQGKRAKIKPA